MAITVNNYQSGVDAGGTTVTVSSYAIGAGTAGQRKLIVSVQMEDFGSATLSGIAFGGTSLTQAATVTAGSNSGWIYELDDADIGSGAQTADVVATFSAAPDDGSISVIWLDGVAQGAATQTATNGSTGATETSITATLTSVAANAIIVNAGGQGDPETMTQDGTQTLAGQVTNGSSHCALAYEIPGSGNHTQGWTGADMRRPNLILAEYAEFSGGGASVTPSAGSISFAGQAPLVQTPVSITVPVGSASLSGFAPTVDTSISISVPAGSLSLSVLAPSAVTTNNILVSVPAGSVSFSSLTPEIQTPVSVEVPLGGISFSGLAPTVNISVLIDVPAGAISVNEYAPAIQTSDNQSVNIPAGALSIALFAPQISVAGPVSVTIPVGVMSFSGFAPSVSGGAIWTVQSDVSSTWSEQSDSAATWTNQTDTSTTWTEV